MNASKFKKKNTLYAIVTRQSLRATFSHSFHAFYFIIRSRQKKEGKKIENRVVAHKFFFCRI